MNCRPLRNGHSVCQLNAACGSRRPQTIDSAPDGGALAMQYVLEHGAFAGVVGNRPTRNRFHSTSASRVESEKSYINTFIKSKFIQIQTSFAPLW